MKHCFFFAGILFAGSCFASGNAADSAGKTITASGWGWTNFGQIVHGHWYGPNGRQPLGNVISHEWREQLGAGLRLQATLAERYEARASVEIGSQLYYSGLIGDQDYGIRQRDWGIYVDEAFGSVKFGDPRNPFLRIMAGYFTYKYNPEVRNLGEYLFRTGVFPGVVMNFFDWPQCRLSGVRINHTAGAFHQDLMLTNETDFPLPPAKDYSLSWVAGIGVGKVLDIGAGVQFAHLLSVNSKLTAPPDSGGNLYYPEGSHANPMSDSLLPGGKFYSFGGVKAMGRICFDPKGLFPNNLFGKEDLKVYAEATALGIESALGYHNYTLYQSDTTWHTIPLQDRTPVVLGFNFPAFKLLDVVAIEWEYYGCPYSLDVWPEMLRGRPAAAIERNGSYSPAAWRDDDIKWSVWAERSFKLFTIKAMIARDHDFMYSYSNGIIRQTIDQKSDWQWNLKLIYAF